MPTTCITKKSSEFLKLKTIHYKEKKFNTDGITTFGESSPANPTRVVWVPKSTTTAPISSKKFLFFFLKISITHLHRKDFSRRCFYLLQTFQKRTYVPFDWNQSNKIKRWASKERIECSKKRRTTWLWHRFLRVRCRIRMKIEKRMETWRPTLFPSITL